MYTEKQSQPLSKTRRAAEVNFELEQFELLPLEVVQTFPRSGELGKDSLGWCVASDRFEYLAKTSRHRNDLPMTEWICTHLYAACGLETAPCRVITWPDKDVVFGSRRLGKSLIVAPGIQLSTKYIDAMGSFVLWKILALDWFVGNFDRRQAQFACFHDSQGMPQARPIDFSRASILREIKTLPDPFSGKTDMATHRFARYIFQRYGRIADVVAVEEMLHTIGQISEEKLVGWIQSAPQEWVVPHLTAALVDFWQSPKRLQRIDRVRQGIRGESLF